ncbi:gamma-glutamylcyclotransferase family protein [Terricaulis silvestris]|uniref:AIG2-like family protein n=1 Tax=Terricaulis silvestris TaxID=2686094 RepID=A0A6I6MN81_9CAUL|nr:gamma-glutamylcyclotransferase family protein [Terricaulis silvestris]QGZ94766.1 AIG2-like family protein [Terricaulis silvestris]
MSEASERLFSYGTLQLPEVQRATFGRLLDGAADALVGFKKELVEITDPDVLAKSGERFHPIVVRSEYPADRVPGTVFAITPTELAAADSYEVSDYKRVDAELASGLRAWVYVKRS